MMTENVSMVSNMLIICVIENKLINKVIFRQFDMIIVIIDCDYPYHSEHNNNSNIGENDYTITLTPHPPLFYTEILVITIYRI